MIAYLEGKIVNIDSPWIVMQTHGVGYEVECTERDCQKLAMPTTSAEMPAMSAEMPVIPAEMPAMPAMPAMSPSAKQAQRVQRVEQTQRIEQTQRVQQALWIYTHVREDKLKLYGFLNKVEKDFFVCLLEVRGIGPKVAMSIIANNVVEEVIDLIVSEKVGSLSRHPKISKKLAELMVLSLKKKLRTYAKEKGLRQRQGQGESPREDLLREQILSALIKLGYTSKEARDVVYSMPLEEIKDLSSGLQHCLSHLSKVKFYHSDTNA